jgi:hypothetical protein
MGFDMAITCGLNMCTQTGRPFFYGADMEKVFDLSQIREVPPEYRRFMVMKGDVFYEYTRSFGKSENIVDAAAFLDGFPPWEEVELDLDLDRDSTEQWTLLDHDKFHAAICWFANANSADANYLVSWSY